MSGKRSMDNAIWNGDMKRSRIGNPHLTSMKSDFLYHIGLGTDSDDFKKLFSDVKFVLLGGQASRMQRFAERLVVTFGIQNNDKEKNYASKNDRYAVYKAGPVLCVSHGVGAPSLSVIFQEILKMLYYAECEDVTYIRIGTCGGIGLEPGSVVVTENVVDGVFQDNYEMKVLGKLVYRPAVVDKQIVQELVGCKEAGDDFNVVSAKTMCADDFYEGQARIDGPFCDYTEEDRLKYLKSLYERGVRNVEMESLCFFSMCHHAGVKAAVICVALLDRLESEEPSSDFETLHAWQDRPLKIVTRFIQKRLNIASKEMT